MSPEAPPLSVLALSPTTLVSGAERVLLDYGRNGISRGEAWTLACPRGPLAELATESGFGWIETPPLRLEGGSRIKSVPALAWRNVQMARILRSIASNFDVVVANSVMSLPSLVAARSGPPVCWLVHDVITRRDLRMVARLGAPAVTLAIGVSDVSAALPSRLGLRTIVVRNGVKWPVERASPPPGPPIIGINAVLTEWKGHRIFLEALSMLDTPFIGEVLGGTFPGDVDYAAELRSLCSDLGLDERVRFLGHSDDPLGRMQQWSVAVSASTEPEAGPLSIMEAMSIGLAIVVTDHGGAPEVARGTGLVVPPGDSAAMAAAITALLTDEAERQRRGASGRDLVAQRYTIDSARTLFSSVISGMVDRPAHCATEASRGRQ